MDIGQIAFFVFIGIAFVAVSALAVGLWRERIQNEKRRLQGPPENLFPKICPRGLWPADGGLLSTWSSSPSFPTNYLRENIIENETKVCQHERTETTQGATQAYGQAYPATQTCCLDCGKLLSATDPFGTWNSEG